MKKLHVVFLVFLSVLITPSMCLAIDSWQYPLNSYLAEGNNFSYFNIIGNGKYHLGEDVDANANTSVFSPAVGIVKHAQYHAPTYNTDGSLKTKNYGGMYIIEHTSNNGQKVCSLFAHLNYASFTKIVGQSVQKGEYLGQIGNIDQNGGFSEHLHFGIKIGAYPSSPNEQICGDWIFSGYTSCVSTLADWYPPSEFIQKPFMIGSYSDGFHSDGTSQSFLDAYHSHSPKIGWPNNNGGTAYVHEVPGQYSSVLSIIAQDFLGDMNQPHFGTDAKSMLVLNDLDTFPKVYLLKDGFYGWYKANDGAYFLGVPFTDEITRNYATSPISQTGDPIQAGDSITVQKFKRRLATGVYYNNERRTLVWKNTSTVQHFAVGEFSFDPMSCSGVCPQAGDQIYIAIDSNPANDIKWPSASITNPVTVPTGIWFTKAGTYNFVLHNANGSRKTGWGVTAIISEGNQQSGGGNGGYVFNNSTITQTVTNGIPSGKNFSFYPEDNYVGIWYELNDVYDPLDITFKWYKPNGDLYGGCGNISDQPTNGYWQSFKAWRFLDISGLTDYGTWKVELYVNDAKIDTQYFELQEYVSGGGGSGPIDTDGDGIADDIDGCPADPNKSVPGICGCGTVDSDIDGDGTMDCIDGCQNDPEKTEAGVCGCGVSDVDTDNDGTKDCQDACQSDQNKTNPGVCGCGVPDTDSDSDGIADCNDEYPLDPGNQTGTTVPFDNTWWADGGTADFQGNTIEFNINSLPPEDWYFCWGREMGVESGKLYRLHFKARAENYSGEGMPLYISVNSAASDYNSLSNFATPVINGTETDYVVDLYVSETDGDASLNVTCGGSTGNLYFSEVYLEILDSPSVLLPVEWWQDGGEVDRIQGKIDFTISSIPLEPWYYCWGQELGVEAGKLYRLHFKARAENYSGNGMPLAVGINSAAPNYYDQSNVVNPVVISAETNFVIDLYVYETDSSASLNITCGNSIGNLYFSEVFLEVLDTPVPSLDNDWWANENAVMNRNVGTVDFSIANQPEYPWDYNWGKVISVGSGQFWRLKFNAQAEDYTGAGMPIEILFTSEDPDWDVISNVESPLITSMETEHVINLLANSTDSTAGLGINCGFAIGNLHFSNVTLELIDALEQSLGNDWWASADAVIDHYTGMVDFQIATEPDYPWDHNWGKEMEVASGQTWQVRFTARAENYLGDGMPIDVLIDSGEPEWSNITNIESLTITNQETEHVINLTVNATDETSGLVFNCGYSVGNLHFSNVSIELINP